MKIFFTTFFILILLFTACQVPEKQVERPEMLDFWELLEEVHDYEQGLQKAKEEKKPILLHFTGWAAISDRKMSGQIMPHPKVAPIILNDFVYVALYVDDQTKLPESEWEEYYLKDKERKVRTVGDKWMKYQIDRFQTNTQPYFAILNEHGDLLIEPRGYISTVDEFVTFLRKGCKPHKKENTWWNFF